MRFKITYLDEKFQRHTSTFEGNSRQEVIEFLNRDSKKIIDIVDIKAKETKSLKKKVNLKDSTLSEFLKQFNILIGAGINIKDAIDILMTQEKNPNLSGALKKVSDGLGEGKTLAESMNSTGIFPSLVINILNAGEISSKMTEGIELLSNHYEEEIKLKQNIKNALYYPMFLLMVTLIIVTLIIAFVLPSFAEVYGMYDNAQLPLLTKIMLSIGSFIGKNSIFILSLLAVVGIFLKALLATERTKYYLSGLGLKLPIIGKYLINLDIQRFSGILSLSILSGIDTIKSLEISINSMNNSHMKNEFKDLPSKVKGGKTLYDSIRSVEIAPDIFKNLINIGESSSNFGHTLKMAYDYFKRMNENSSKKISALVEPVIIILVSIVVGAVVLAIALPTFNIINVI